MHRSLANPAIKTSPRRSVTILPGILAIFLGVQTLEASADEPRGAGRDAGVGAARETVFPPSLPEGKAYVTDTSSEFLRPPTSRKLKASVAETPPTIDFLYYPGQTYPGRPWSNWGDGLAVNGKYYSSIGDHLAIGVKGDGAHGNGNAFVYEYDPEKKAFRTLVDLARTLNLPNDHYAPGKIHSRLDLGRDGRLYFSTHRGSEKAAIDRNHYEGDWILRCDPKTGETEVVAKAPVPKHAIPCGVLDPDRLIFYGGTAAGPDAELAGIRFLAYDVLGRRPIHSGPNGPARALIFAKSTGRVYFVPGTGVGPLSRFDPRWKTPPEPVVGVAPVGLRAASDETRDGYVYAVSSGQGASDAEIWSFHTGKERVAKIGSVAVGAEAYVTSIDADPSGRYLYYIPGAHGSGDRDGSPIVQFDVKTGRKKVIAFLHPFYQEKYGCALKGTYSSALSPEGDKLYVTWNASRGGRSWDCCALTVIHIPESERRP